MTITTVGLGWLAPAVQAETAPQGTTTTSPTTSPHFDATTTTVPAATTTLPTTKTGPRSTAATSRTTSTTSTTVAPTVTTFPPGLLAIANSVHRSPPSNDAALMAALAPLKELGYTAQQAMIAGMGQFPVAGPAFYTDDWLEPRPGGRLHQGDDIIAAMGTPIRASVAGVLTYDASDPTGYGLAAIVTGPDKTVYLNGHLSATVTGLATGSAVGEGQVIGFVGESGDATGPHDHFEVHPFGGAGVDPKPILDSWQAAAIKGIPALMRSIRGTPAPTVAAPGPLQMALPTPQAAFSPALPLPLSTRRAPTPEKSLAGLAFLAFLALMASSGLGVARFRRGWLPGFTGRGARPAGPPTPTR